MEFMSEMSNQYQMFQAELSLIEMLIGARNARVSDARDKVYGLLGACVPTKIRVCYDESMTLADLYYEATVVCIGDDLRRLRDILCCVDHRSPLEGLPSWVPDWSLSRTTTSLGFEGASHCIYAASIANAHFKIPANTRFAVSANGKELLIEQSILFDVIKDVGGVCSVPNLAFEEPGALNKHLIEWIDLAKRCGPYPSGSTLFDAFWHTLAAGKPGDGRTKSPSSFSEIFSLLLDESTGSSPTFADQSYSARQLRPQGRGKLELASLRTRGPRKTYDEICSALERAMLYRCVGTTEKRYLGLFPRQVQPGDVICILVGFHVPYVLRKAGNGKYTLVGECYVHGVMNGEVMGMGFPHSKIMIV